MSTRSPSRPVAHQRARVAALSRGRSIDDPELLDARRRLKAERLAEYIRKTVDAAPPLTPEQRDRLSILLRGGAPLGVDRVTRPQGQARDSNSVRGDAA